MVVLVDSVVIVSGGMDSVTLLHYAVKKLGKNPAVISFLYGQKHAKEIEFARKHVQRLGCETMDVIDLTILQSAFSSSALVSADLAVPSAEEVKSDAQPATYVPNRNMIFLAVAAGYAENLGVTSVYYGAQAHDLYGYWDTTPEFLHQLNQVYRLNREAPITIEAPFVNFSKTEVLRLGLELEVDYSETWSCYQGGALACGTCPTCAERLKAFQELGIPDPVPYV